MIAVPGKHYTSSDITHSGVDTGSEDRTVYLVLITCSSEAMAYLPDIRDLVNEYRRVDEPKPVRIGLSDCEPLEVIQLSDEKAQRDWHPMNPQQICGRYPSGES